LQHMHTLLFKKEKQVLDNDNRRYQSSNLWKV
jgi:hypothetical protein